MSKDIDAKIRSYMVLKERTKDVFENVNTGRISADTGVAILADIVGKMLDIGIIRAEALKKLREEIANAPICMV